MLLTWFLTVCLLMCKQAAISLLLYPRANNDSTSFSLGVSKSSNFALALASFWGGGQFGIKLSAVNKIAPPSVSSVGHYIVFTAKALCSSTLE